MGRALELLEALDPEILVDAAGELRTHPRNRTEETLRRDLAFESVEQRETAAMGELGHMGGDRRPDRGERVERLDTSAVVQLDERLPVRAGRRRRATVRSHPIAVRFLGLEQVGDALQDVCDLGIRDRAKSAHGPCSDVAVLDPVYALAAPCR